MKFENTYFEQYAGAKEENRLFKSKAHNTEFVITLHYIKKYIHENSKVLDIGAGTGIYTRELSERGCVLDAVDLHPDNIKRMKFLFENNDNVYVRQANALDLNVYKDNSFDFVLEMGPLYHIHTKSERIQAIKEAVRVAKKGAAIFFAFCLQDAPLVQYAFQSDNPTEALKEIKYNKRTARVLENTGSSIFLDTIDTINDLIKSVFEELPVSLGPRFAQDGLSHIIRESINNMSEGSYREWINYLIATAERQDLIGYSNHIVQVLIKK